jgi:hypothetical protein
MSLGSNTGNRYWLVAWVLSILAVIAACGTISPRRVVINNPSPTPTVSPSISPTPTPFPTPTITPTPTPTPTAMAAVVPNQFLFTADPAAGVILGFKINRDGGLSPVPGSPFVVADSPRLVAAAGENLFVAGKTKLTLFRANKETGSIQKTDVASVPQLSALLGDSPMGTVFASTPAGELAIRVINQHMEVSKVLDRPVTSVRSQASAIDRTGKFMYTVDSATATISVFTVRDGTPDPASLRSYAAGRASTSLAIVKP